MDPNAGDGKKALLVIAPQNFRDEEYFDTKEVLEQAGVTVTTASSRAGGVTGMLGRTANAGLGLGEVKGADYDAVLFIGGVGSQAYFNDTKAHEIAKEASEAGRIVGAICIAPVILANAGLLHGKKATCFAGEFESQIEAGGAEFTRENVVRDDNVITANGPAAAREFGAVIVQALAEK